MWKREVLWKAQVGKMERLVVFVSDCYPVGMLSRVLSTPVWSTRDRSGWRYTFGSVQHRDGMHSLAITRKLVYTEQRWGTRLSLAHCSVKERSGYQQRKLSNSSQWCRRKTKRVLCSRSQVKKAFEGLNVCSNVSNDTSQTSSHINIITQG